MGWWLGGDLGAGGHLEWTAPDGVWMVAAAAALVALAAAAWGRRPVGLRVGELLAWAGALAGLVVALARPVWVEEEGRTDPGRTAVLVDASASMAVLEDGTPRSEAAQAKLEALVAEGAEVFHFGYELAAGAPGTYDRPGTDLAEALDGLRDRFAGESLEAVVLLTDGLDRGRLRTQWQQGEAPVPPEVPGPLTIHQVGTRDDLRDLSVQRVDAGGYAYVHTPFRIAASLRGVGFEGRTVPVELLQDGKPLSTLQVTLDEQGRADATFEVDPDRAGRFSYIVRVPVYEDDAVPGNNTLPLVVSVVRDQIRVLQVAGAPSWDVKFLRRFLKGDPSVDLVSFFILRTTSDMRRRYDDDELSLIQFPYPQLFNEDLHTFDLVVFQNFDYRPYFRGQGEELLENLYRYVADDGHAFVMTGGDRSFSLGAYGGTPLGRMLPVDVPDTSTEPDVAPFRAELTEAGARHPVTRLVADPVENTAWWSRLYPVDGTNRVGDAVPGASVLLEHPTLRTPSGRKVPILSVREVGEGRTMALTTDTSWRWSLSEAAEGRGNQAYLRFWKGALRWLVGDPTTRRVAVSTQRENYGLGETVSVTVRARDADYAPLPDAKVEVELSSTEGSVRLEGVTGPDGEVVLSHEVQTRGAHRVEAEVRHRNSTVGEGDTVFAVTTRDPELDEVVPDTAFLAWLAERTEGQLYADGEDGPILRDATAGRTSWERREIPVWRAPILALWIAGLAGLAWLLRRRAGLR